MLDSEDYVIWVRILDFHHMASKVLILANNCKEEIL